MVWKLLLIGLLVAAAFSLPRLMRALASADDAPGTPRAKNLVRCPVCGTLKPEGEVCACERDDRGEP